MKIFTHFVPLSRHSMLPFSTIILIIVLKAVNYLFGISSKLLENLHQIVSSCPPFKYVMIYVKKWLKYGIKGDTTVKGIQDIRLKTSKTIGMNKFVSWFLLVFMLLLMSFSADTMQSVLSVDRTFEAEIKKPLKAFKKPPVLFARNEGQLDDRVKYYAKSAGQTFYFTSDSIFFDLKRYVGREDNDTADRNNERLLFSIDFLGANKNPSIEARDKTDSIINYLMGDNPDNWHTGMPTYKQLVYSEIYPSIDLILYSKEGALEYDFIVNPGASTAVIAMACTGVNGLMLEGDDLVISTAFGDIKQTKPYIYQEIGGHAVEIDGGFKQIDDRTYGFEAAAYDTRYPLIIDPSLEYSTYLGGNGYDFGWSVAIDDSGCTYITGYTMSSDFPIDNPYQGIISGITDAFVTKLSSTGNAIIYSTFFGGIGNESVRSIVVDNSGCAYVLGTTSSPDFPTNNPYQASLGGSQDAFVTKFSPSGETTIYSTYLGGNSTADNDQGRSIAIDDSGCAYVTGSTDSDSFPTNNPYQSTRGGSTDAFVTKLSATGNTIVYSTYLGGDSTEWGRGIAVDNSGAAYIAGYTYSTDFPTNNPYQAALSGISDAFVTKLSITGDTTAYSTYLGGSGVDNGHYVAVDSLGFAYVTGYTGSSDFPINNPYQAALGGGEDVFITKLSAAGNTTAYSTYLGGDGTDHGFNITIDNSGRAYATGRTDSTDFPTINPYQDISGGLEDVFITRLAASGNSADFSTYLGGSSNDGGYGIAVDSFGFIYIAGRTESADFPIKDAYQGTPGGGSDTFVIKIDPTVIQLNRRSIGSPLNHYYLSVDVAGNKQKLLMTYPSCKLTKMAKIATPDGILSITLLKGTAAKQESGEPLLRLNVATSEISPMPQGNKRIVGRAFEFSPEGANFSPPIILTVSYEDVDIPKGVSEADLVLASYDEESEAWVEMPSTVNSENNTVTTEVSHFTKFAIIADVMPAEFFVFDLSISKEETKPGETVDVSVAVANIGGVEGEYSLLLKVNGKSVGKRDLTLASSETETVNFKISQEEPGTYLITVNGLNVSYTVIAPVTEPVSGFTPEQKSELELPPTKVTETAPVPSTPAPVPLLPQQESATNWLLIGIIVAVGVLVIIYLVYRLNTRKD